MFFIFYHNIRVISTAWGVCMFLTGTGKTGNKPPETRQKRAGLCFTACTSMRAGRIARKFTPFSWVSPVSGVLPIRNGERGRNLLRGREALRRRSEPVFSTFRNARTVGDCCCGKCQWLTTIHRRGSWLDSRVNTVAKTLKRRFDFRSRRRCYW